MEPSGRNRDYSEINPIRREIFMSWDGNSKSISEWKGLKRDPALWWPNGDCFIYMCKRGEPKRCPVFKIPFKALEAARCQPLLDKYLCRKESSTTRYEIYIPTPASARRDQSQLFTHHLAIRNFFAWVLDRSLVGLPNLGGALVGLLNSMYEFRTKAENNLASLMEYMDREGYSDMKDSPDYALAILFFAEHCFIGDLWLKAFTYCIGMHNRLNSSPELEYISQISKSLITNAQTEMNLRLDSCGDRLTNFLSSEDSFLSFSANAKTHITKFRSFLENYHVTKFRYWPPSRQDSPELTQNMYGQMSVEFEKLYEYLASGESVSDADQTLALGGICVLQNIQDFDRRHGYEALACQLPLLPFLTENGRRGGKRLSMNGNKNAKFQERLLVISALFKATNSNALDCPLVRAYRTFEQDLLLTESHHRLTPIEIRKIHWILIYQIHQTLLSLIHLSAKIPPQNPPSDNPVVGPREISDDQGRTPSSLPPYSLIDGHGLQPDIDWRPATSPSAFTSRSGLGSKTVFGERKAGGGHLRRTSLRVKVGLSLNALSNIGNRLSSTPNKPSHSKPACREVVLDGYGNGIVNHSSFQTASLHLLTSASQSTLGVGGADGKYDDVEVACRRRRERRRRNLSVREVLDEASWREPSDFFGREGGVVEVEGEEFDFEGYRERLDAYKFLWL